MMQRLCKHLSLIRLGLLALAGLLVLGSLLLSVNVRALEPTEIYELSWHTIDGGGRTWSTGGTYTLGSTVGQPDAGKMDGGSYALSGGFWVREALAEVLYKIYLPAVLGGYEP